MLWAISSQTAQHKRGGDEMGNERRKMNGDGKEYKRKNREIQRYIYNSVKFSTNITTA
jgi:hypothetical protein